ncbi:magnesium/cobalt transporter CorA [Chitinophaga pendula]|uniref:magnesium/cobalt transporter CorA n=1 Tax=Chitinophaga TaxID=79328 RepID=UPI000BAF9CEF|nr:MULTISPECIES: magnesium/cobalt transporter CorA [Chitinophaga]ASZ10346.1 magnesium and cobalt transport protein CorA [Chitinophaga sp. MD30]UCJ06691.1 magnesium/cobalt transporter CorA [Chitinophaga pendula]
MSKRNILPIPEVLDVLNPFKVKKQRLMSFNPVTSNISRKDAECITITVFDYDGKTFEEIKVTEVEDVFKYLDTPQVSWINIDGIRKEAVHAICIRYGIHYLIEEDILSIGQRAKMDEIGDRLFCLLPMIYFNKESSTIEQEQVGIVLGKNFVISFQEDPRRDVFDPVRERLRIAGSRLRMAGADYLCYSLIDIIVDNYFTVMERLGERIELMEDVIQHQPNTRALARINFLRRELAFFKRGVLPVRDLVNGFLKTESSLLDERTTKYFKDVYDHIVQASELIESYRDMMLNLQELYHTQLNVKMNEVMKVLAVVTTLMAPLTVIAGIYGMNFDNMPELHSPHGYFITLGVMVVLFILMIIVFKKRGWF